MYMLTGEQRYLVAMEGAWSLMRNHWIHVGGSIAINEGGRYPPGSYYLEAHPTGELCGYTPPLTYCMPTFPTTLLFQAVVLVPRCALPRCALPRGVLPYRYHDMV